jgi:hypothetical protein
MLDPVTRPAGCVARRPALTWLRRYTPHDPPFALEPLIGAKPASLNATVSRPCSSSSAFVTSPRLAAVPITLGTKLLLASTLTWAFMPNYHRFLAHLRLAHPLAVLRRTRGHNDRRIDDRALPQQ